MDIQTVSRAVADTIGKLVGHGAAAPYGVAFLSSTAVEVIAAAAILTMLALGLVRSIFRSTTISDRWPRLYRVLDVLKLYKMVIPLACLSATVWVWSLMEGA
jgi:hypothetical protein